MTAPTKLRVSPGLSLPIEVVTDKQAILAMSGAGKSNAAVAMAEEMYRCGVPWVVIDPKGDWWGIRAGADGKSEGLPIPVLGGLHGDLALEPGAGALIASLVAERRLTCVLDVSEFNTRQEMFRFLADFATTLLKKNTMPLHVFAEEADDYLPQRTSEKGELPRCLGAWQRLIKRGRFRGIGSTIITQRSSAINKDVLNMTDSLYVMRMTAPLDHKAIRPWITEHGIGEELIDSLPTLENGEAWVWSPQRLKLVERITFRRRSTFDSGATPFSLGKATQTATLADVDLVALKTEMAETVERAENEDPKKLHAKIKKLEKDLGIATQAHETRYEVGYADALSEVAQLAPEPIEVEIPVPFIPPSAVAAAQVLTQHAEQTAESARRMVEALSSIEPPAAPAPKPVAPKPAARPAPQPSPPPVADRRPAAPVGGDTDVSLGDGTARKLLRVLAHHPDGLMNPRLAALAGVGQKKSTLRNALAKLRNAGLVGPGQPVVATEAGLALIADDVAPLPTGRELLDHWRGRLGGVPLRMFDELVAAYPEGIERDVLAERLGLDPTQSTIRNAMAKLRAQGLVAAHGYRADDHLMAAIS